MKPHCDDNATQARAGRLYLHPYQH